MEKVGSAHWEGLIKEGEGSISTESGALKNQPYGFNTRFENVPGSNPEELIGAAHAACFSMALSLKLEEAGMEPESIDTRATVKLEKDGEDFSIPSIHLDLKARVPGADQSKFEEVANAVKEGCPVSKLVNAKITLSSHLQA
ncbi:OsmC family protein [Proteobacteria bacterium 005FR1]|nr:OsmC family protein [Proteobacteria bacterium 005FR1]